MLVPDADLAAGRWERIDCADRLALFRFLLGGAEKVQGVDRLSRHPAVADGYPVDSVVDDATIIRRIRSIVKLRPEPLDSGPEFLLVNRLAN